MSQQHFWKKKKYTKNSESYSFTTAITKSPSYNQETDTTYNQISSFSSSESHWPKPRSSGSHGRWKGKSLVSNAAPGHESRTTHGKLDCGGVKKMADDNFPLPVHWPTFPSMSKGKKELLIVHEWGKKQDRMWGSGANIWRQKVCGGKLYARSGGKHRQSKGRESAKL